MEILTSVKRLYISFKSLVNDFVYSFGRAALLLLVEVWNHTVPVRERGRIRVISSYVCYSLAIKSLLSRMFCYTLADLHFTDCLQFGGLGFLSLVADTLLFASYTKPNNGDHQGFCVIGIGVPSLKIERSEHETDYSLI